MRAGPTLVAAAIVLTGCTSPSGSGSGGSTPTGPGPVPSTTLAPTSMAPTPAPTRAPAPTYAIPLVLAVHPTRTVADVPLADARRLVASGGSRWSVIKQPGGAMKVVTTRDRSPAKALAEVRADDNTVAVVPATAVDPRVRVLTVAGRHPLRDPGRYPLTIEATQPPPEVTTLSAVGDIMLGRRVARASGDDPAKPLRPLAKRLASAEITVGNFESTLSDNGRPTQGGDSFAADPDVGKGLKLAGFDLLSLANNHLGDYGNGAMRTTFDRFEDLKVLTVGAGRNLDQARRPVVITRNGVKVGFIAVDSIGETPAANSRQPGTNRLNMPPRTGPLNRGQLDRISADIRRLDRQVDTVVVMTHWGTQYTHRPEASQRTAARAFANAGADLVLGGHPHWVQGWEMAGSAVVIHSLGNFIFDMDFQVKTNEGVFVEVVLWDGKVKAVEPVPYVINGDFVPKRVTGARAQSILEDVWSTSRGPFDKP